MYRKRVILKGTSKMNVIQEIIIGNHSISMFNSIEEPLFDCQQVIINLLGYDKSGENRFYKDNKNNDKYIRGADCLPTMLIQHPVQKRYFTELGLYRCLFTSYKPIAIEFQEQVAQLLKDIRIGNLKLAVQKECETTMKDRWQHDRHLKLLKYHKRTGQLLYRVRPLRMFLCQQQVNNITFQIINDDIVIGSYYYYLWYMSNQLCFYANIDESLQL